MSKQELIADRNSRYQFAKANQLVNLWVRTYYPDKSIVVLYDCSVAFANIPMLSIMKRDDLKSYILGLLSDVCFIEFESIEKAKDYILMFLHNQVVYGVYENGELIITNGSIKQTQSDY